MKSEAGGMHTPCVPVIGQTEGAIFGMAQVEVNTSSGCNDLTENDRPTEDAKGPSANTQI